MEIARTNRKAIQALVDQVPLSDFCTWLNIEESSKGFYLVETTDGLGAIFEVSVPVYMGNNYEDKFIQIIKENYPSGAVMQMFCYASSNIKPILDNYVAYHRRRPNIDHPEVLIRMIEKRAEYYLKAAEEGFWAGVRYKPRVFRNFISLHIPFKAFDDDLKETYIAAEEYIVKLRSSLESAELHPRPINGTEFRTLLYEIFNTGLQGVKEYNEDRPLRNQVIDTTTCYKIVETKDKNTDLCILQNDKKKYVRLYSITGFPRQMTLWEFNNMLFSWSFSNVVLPLSSPFGMNLTIVYEDWRKTKMRIQNKAIWNMRQAENNPLARYIPKISKRAKESEYILNLIEEGAIPLQAYYSMFLTATNQSELESVSSDLLQRFESIGFELQRENDKALVGLFLESLPLNSMNERFEFYRRRSTLFDSNIGSMIPLISGTSGSSVPDELLIDRKGQILFFDRFTSDSNYNMVKIAESGGGKSFGQANSHIHLLTSGTKIRIIDVGRSYEVFCRDIGGEFIAITKERRPCFNFFTNMLVDEEGNIHEDEMDTIVPLVGFLCGIDISKQIADEGSENLNARCASIIINAINTAWERKRNEAGLADVANVLLEMEDVVGDNLPRRLYQALEPYAKGVYASYFNGKNNIQYSKDYVILELEEVEQKDARLQAAIIFSIIIKLLREVFIEWQERRQRIVVDVDEAWSIFEKIAAKSFMEAAARRFRKYDSSLGVITQGIDDMYKSETTKAIWANCAHKIFLKMPANLIEKAVKESKITLDEFEREWFKTIKTVKGKFSEIFFLSPAIYGIARLVVDRYSYGVFTTKKEEKDKLRELAKQYNVSIGDVLEMMTTRKPIGQFLIESGVPELQVYLALKYQAEEAPHLKLGEILKMMGVDEKIIEKALKLQEGALSWEKVFGNM